MMSASRCGKDGGLLISLVIMMTVLAALGSAILAMTTSSMRNRITVSVANRAYYLAESGAAYVKAERAADSSALPSGTFQFSNGDQFIISTTDTDGGVKLTSTGVANPGSGIESRRRITVEIVDSTLPEDVVPIGFDFDDDGSFDTDTWGVEGVTKAQITSTGPSGNQAALDLKGQRGSIYLKWQNNPDTDLSSAWTANGKLLSYQVQMKIKPFDTGNQQAYSKHYMLGLSFRLDSETETSYGLSFFRSLAVSDKGNKLNAPVWMPDDFEALRGTNVYVVLWYQANGNVSLLNYRTLVPPDTAVETRDNVTEMLDYSTLLVKLDEQFSGPGGARENHISAYIQDTSVYPLWDDIGDAVWTDDTTVFPGPILWEDPVTLDHTDSLLTSENFSVDEPAEIGVHVFYDQAGSDKKFFDDFSFRMEGFSGGGGGTGSEIQY